MIFKVYLAVLIFASTALAQKDAGNGEVVFDDPEGEDKTFDDGLYPEQVSPPRETPTNDEVQQLADATFGTAVGIEVDLAVSYITPQIWYTNYTACCPRCQNYQCGVNSQRLPCFYYSGLWCCPMRPYYIANCNCGSCVEVCPEPQCFSIGRCARKYRWTVVYAVCYRDGWSWPRAIWRYLPSSCYCTGSCSVIGR